MGTYQADGESRRTPFTRPNHQSSFSALYVAPKLDQLNEILRPIRDNGEHSWRDQQDWGEGLAQDGPDVQ